MEKLAIIYQTFLRDELMKRTVKSITDNWQENYHLLIGDQNSSSDKFELASHKDCAYIPLGYDIGLSASRNFLVEIAHKLGIKYVLISADSIAFTDKYNFQPIIDFIKYKNDNAIIGLKLANRQPFEYDMTIDRNIGKFILSKPSSGVSVYQGVRYQRCDIVKNFFVAPTELLIKCPWNNELKMCLEKNTPIIVKNGYNQIKNIPIKSLFPHSYSGNTYSFSTSSKLRIWTDTGWKKIIKISRRKDKPMLLELQSPSSILQCTDDHRLIVDDIEKEASKFKIGDKINLINYPELSNILKVDLDFAWMLGFFLAEGTCGCSGRNKNRIEFTNQNIEQLRKCESIFHKIGVETKWYIKRGRKDKCSFLRVASPALMINYFKEFYYNDSKKAMKIIPYYVFNFDKMSRNSFIEGFLDGDGYKKVHGHFAQKSASVVNGLFHLSRDLEYTSFSVSKNKNEYGSWFKAALKVHKTANSDIIDKITDIENTDDYVYDIECEGHRFCAGIGNVLVHNCEHETEFLQFKENNVEVYYTDKISAEYIDEKPPEYKVMRNRLYSEFVEKMCKIMKMPRNVTGWIDYPIERW